MTNYKSIAMVRTRGQPLGWGRGSDVQGQENQERFPGNLRCICQADLQIQLLCPEASKEGRINVHTVLPPGRITWQRKLSNDRERNHWNRSLLWGVSDLKRTFTGPNQIVLVHN